MKLYFLDLLISSLDFILYRLITDNIYIGYCYLRRKAYDFS